MKAGKILFVVGDWVVGCCETVNWMFSRPRNWRATWWAIAEFIEILWLCRGSLFPVLIGGALLVFADQARDILIAERSVNYPLSFLVSVFVWALSAWYWARVTLGFTFVLPILKPSDRRITGFEAEQFEWCAAVRECLRVQIPRLIGTTAIAALAVAFYKAWEIHWDAGDPAGRIWPPFAEATGPAEQPGSLRFFWWFVSCGMLALVFYAAVWQRVQFTKHMVATFARFQWLAADDHPRRHRIRDVTNWLSRSVLILSIVCAPVLSLLFSLDPIDMSDAFGGAINSVLLGFAVMIPVVSALAIASARLKLPVLGLVVTWMAFSASLCGDNHDVRLIDSDTKFTDRRQHIVEAFEAWHAFNTREEMTRPLSTRGQQVTAPPMIVVATAGGASRAAYWTSQVLGLLAEREVGFADRVFAISGVSGGSLGAMFFRSVVDVNRERMEDRAPALHFTQLSRDFMAHDFLGPALAIGLYIDLPRHAFPVGMRQDRAAALELAWEVAWQSALDKAVRAAIGPVESAATLQWDRGFVEAFGPRLAKDLRKAPYKAWPVLALNGSSVEKGKRIVTSNVRLEGSWLDKEGHLRDGLAGPGTRYDTFGVLGADIPASTAATMSARFPVVSPTGGLRDAGRQSHGRVTDGGLFENFGAATADEIMRHIVERNRDSQSGRRLVTPIAIVISSDPSLDQLERDTGSSAAQPDCDYGPAPQGGTEPTPPDGEPADRDLRPLARMHPVNKLRECLAEPATTALIVGDPLNSLYTGRVARGEVAAIALHGRVLENRYPIRSQILDQLDAQDRQAMHRRLNYDNHKDFFHFRQCRVPNLKGPTMSWHDSASAWASIDRMLGIVAGADGRIHDPCGNAAEFFRLCMRLQTLSGYSSDDKAASVECAKRWPEPASWRCSAGSPSYCSLGATPRFGKRPTGFP